MKALAFLVVLFASGCLAPAHPAGCGTEACPDSPQGAPARGWFDDGKLELQGCQGGTGWLYVPDAQVRAILPEAFEVASIVPYSATILFGIEKCSRVTANSTVYVDVSILRSVAFVSPANRAWAAAGTHYYVLDVFVSEPQLAAALTHSLGAKAAKFDAVAVPGGSVQPWSVQAGDCRMDLSFRRTGRDSTTSSGVFHYWVGEDSYRRFESHQKYTYDWLTDLSVDEVTGTCRTAQAVGLVRGVLSQAQGSFDAVWSLSSEEYR